MAILNGVYRYRYSVAKNYWFAGQGPSPDEVLKPPSLSYKNVPFLKRSALLTLVFLSSLYGYQRMHWLGADSCHYQAKEYFVAGQVVYAHRLLFDRINLHPENPIVRPYTLLQKAIFHYGEKYLPSVDGERDVWFNSWFIYPFSRKTIQPYWVRTKKPSPKMVGILDSCWEAMDGIATKPIADPLMERKALLEWPFLFSYYLTWQGFYTGPLRLSNPRIFSSTMCRKQQEQMLVWIDSLSNRWLEKRLTHEIWKDYPYVASFRQDVLMYLLQNLTLSLTAFGEFSCDHPLVGRMYEEYQAVMSADPIRNSYLNLQRVNKEQATAGYQSALYRAEGSAGNYLLHYVCGKEMPQELYRLVKKNGFLSSFYPAHRVEHGFRISLKPLLKRGNNE